MMRREDKYFLFLLFSIFLNCGNTKKYDIYGFFNNNNNKTLICHENKHQINIKVSRNLYTNDFIYKEIYSDGSSIVKKYSCDSSGNIVLLIDKNNKKLQRFKEEVERHNSKNRVRNIWYRFNTKKDDTWYVISDELGMMGPGLFAVTLDSVYKKNTIEQKEIKIFRFLFFNTSELDSEYLDWVIEGKGLCARQYVGMGIKRYLYIDKEINPILIE